MAPLLGHAQQTPDTPPPTTSPSSNPSPVTGNTSQADTKAQDPKAQDTKAQDPKAEDATDEEVPKRIFWIIPNFMTANDQPQNRGPLTTRQKYTIAWHQFADPSAHFGNLLQASISQAADGIPHYGQGWGAFGERFLAQEGDQFTQSFLIYGVLPQLLHQDPRYFRKGTGSALTRIGYAASRAVIARSDHGNPMLNASQVFGQLGQAAISLSYYPQQDRDVKGLFLGWAVNQTYNIGWNQLKEFSPDLNAYLKRRARRKRAKQLEKQHFENPAQDGKN